MAVILVLCRKVIRWPAPGGDAIRGGNDCPLMSAGRRAVKREIKKSSGTPLRRVPISSSARRRTNASDFRASLRSAASGGKNLGRAAASSLPLFDNGTGTPECWQGRPCSPGFPRCFVSNRFPLIPEIPFFFGNIHGRAARHASAAPRSRVATEVSVSLTFLVSFGSAARL